MSNSSPSILVLEDTESLSSKVSETLRSALPEAGVCAVASLEQAREKIAEQAFDLLVLDASLPDGDAADFLIEAQGARPGTRAIYLTNSPVASHENQTGSPGVLTFLRKPTRMSKLRKVAGDLLQPATEPPAEMSLRGQPSRLTPMDLVQLHCLSGATLDLEIARPDSATGRICLRRGQLVHAEAGTLQGEPAFYAIAGWRRGSVTEVMKPAAVAQTIQTPWLTLLMNAAQRRDEAMNPATPRAATPPASPSAPPAQPAAAGTINVLVAEDDAVVAHLVEFKLRQQGFNVSPAQDGEAALQLLKTERPSLIILDVMMPVINGFQVLEEIKRNPGLKATPVILLTAKGRDADIERGLEMGAADYIVKPFSPSELMARVKKALRDSDLR